MTGVNRASSSADNTGTESPRKYEPVIATMCTSEPFITSRSSAPRRLASTSAETWWNSSIASTVPLNTSGASFSNANRNVAWVQISTASGPFRKSMNAPTLPWEEPGSQRLCSGLTSQSAKKPCFVSSVEENDAPIERSGTATMTLLRSWL